MFDNLFQTKLHESYVLTLHVDLTLKLDPCSRKHYRGGTPNDTRCPKIFGQTGEIRKGRSSPGFRGRQQDCNGNILTPTEDSGSQEAGHQTAAEGRPTRLGPGSLLGSCSCFGPFARPFCVCMCACSWVSRLQSADDDASLAVG